MFLMSLTIPGSLLTSLLQAQPSRPRPQGEHPPEQQLSARRALGLLSRWQGGVPIIFCCLCVSDWSCRQPLSPAWNRGGVPKAMSAAGCRHRAQSCAGSRWGARTPQTARVKGQAKQAWQGDVHGDQTATRDSKTGGWIGSFVRSFIHLFTSTWSLSTSMYQALLLMSGIHQQESRDNYSHEKVWGVGQNASKQCTRKLILDGN